jgi:hypothetical protein
MSAKLPQKLLPEGEIDPDSPRLRVAKLIPHTATILVRALMEEAIKIQPRII